MKYRLYVDEVGNPDLNSSADENHRFLCLAGIIIDLDYVIKVLSPELEALKVKYFGSHPDKPIILHRKEILYKKPPFSTLQNPETELRFNNELLDKLRAWNYFVITVIIDKREHSEKYSTWRYDPYELKVKSKQANIAGLQVADLIAHPARRWCFKNFFGMDDALYTFGDRVIEILECEKFFRYNGEIRSYGAKKLP